MNKQNETEIVTTLVRIKCFSLRDWLAGKAPSCYFIHRKCREKGVVAKSCEPADSMTAESTIKKQDDGSTRLCCESRKNHIKEQDDGSTRLCCESRKNHIKEQDKLIIMLRNDVFDLVQKNKILQKEIEFETTRAKKLHCKG